MTPFSKHLNKKLDKILRAYPTRVAAARALGIPPGSITAWAKNRESGRSAALRLEVACDQLLTALKDDAARETIEDNIETPEEEIETPEVVVAKPLIRTRSSGTTLPNLILMKRLDTLEAKIDALLGACGIDPEDLK